MITMPTWLFLAMLAGDAVIVGGGVLIAWLKFESFIFERKRRKLEARGIFERSPSARQKESNS